MTPNATSDNPRIPRLFRGVTWAEFAVLAVFGLLLYAAPETAADVWPWDLTPFNTRFLGAIYVGAVVAVGTLGLVGRWAPARLVVWMVLAFTTVALVVTLASPSRFDNHWYSTVVWFLIYGSIPVVSAFFLWSRRGEPVGGGAPTTGPLRSLLLAQAVVLGGYGVALLAAPEAASGFWPWDLDAFHGRLYSALFFASAAGSLVASRVAAVSELVALSGTLLLLGALEVAGLALVDASVDRVDWTAAGTWIWVGGFAVLAAAGGWLALSAARRAGSRP
jgi:hypothetical protein